jgi:hypothetical protein
MIEVVLSGFLFLFIIITNILSGRFGYETFSELNADTKLQTIDRDPKKFKTASLLIIIEHFAIICLAVMLFVAFNPYNLLLAIVWTIFRALEGAIQIYYKKNYWGLLNLAKQYQNAPETERSSLADSALGVLKTKNKVFASAQLLFSVGTLAYSILFATTSAGVPELIGWFGIISSAIYGIGNGIYLAKPDFKALWNVGGLLIFVFELILGCWLLFSTLL